MKIASIVGLADFDYANARLVAAAPDLLAACRAFERWDTDPHATEADAAAVREAIREATRAANP